MLSFYFYDLETSGFNPREARIMQFAGQRTSLALEPMGEPDNLLIAMTDDTLPDPDAILVTGITPQQTIADGMSEAAFLQYFENHIATPDTIFVGYNSVRFDDEFMRFLHYRNFYDAYEWQWKDGRSKWDLLDVVRMTRALRPEGIVWPFAPNGAPTNRLELLTSLNDINHYAAHDALSDVHATIAVARLIRQKQPKLFEYLLSTRDKKAVAALVQSGKPFVYSSGKYSSEFEKTTVAIRLGDHPKKQGALVYDLRHDPTPFLAMTAAQLVQAWQWQKEPDPARPRLPVKTLQFNRCPAVAPLSVWDEDTAKRLQLDAATIKANQQKLQAAPDFVSTLTEALSLMDKEQQTRLLSDELDVDARLYDGFITDQDKTKMRVVRAADANDISDLQIDFSDSRLEALLPLYKARNFPRQLNDADRETWEAYRQRRLLGGKQSSRMVKFFARLAQLAQDPGLSDEKRYLLEELQLYAQSITPVEY